MTTLTGECTVQADGVVTFRLPPETQLSPGVRHAMLIIEETKVSPEPSSLLDYLGKGKGLFASPEEADRFLRQERDAWE